MQSYAIKRYEAKAPNVLRILDGLVVDCKFERYEWERTIPFFWSRQASEVDYVHILYREEREERADRADECLLVRREV